MRDEEGGRVANRRVSRGQHPEPASEAWRVSASGPFRVRLSGRRLVLPFPCCSGRLRPSASRADVGDLGGVVRARWPGRQVVGGRAPVEGGWGGLPGGGTGRTMCPWRLRRVPSPATTRATAHDASDAGGYPHSYCCTAGFTGRTSAPTRPRSAAGLVRVEVADAASAKRPPRAPPLSTPDGESGRGLLLVDALAVRWGSASASPAGQDGVRQFSSPPSTSEVLSCDNPGYRPEHGLTNFSASNVCSVTPGSRKAGGSPLPLTAPARPVPHRIGLGTDYGGRRTP